ncbi:MAG: creatininase family protein [Polyangiales bacterium]
MIQLSDLPHARARDAVDTGAPVFLFVNPVEYHGPHLPLHNDHLISVGLAKDLHARLAARDQGLPFLSAGELEIGVEPTRGLGSRFAPFDVAQKLVREACRSLAELGARRVVLMTFHGDPLHNIALEAGVVLLRELGVNVLSPFNAVLRELLAVDSSVHEPAFDHIEDKALRKEMLRDLHLDFHGGFFETSMTLRYAPESVDPSYVNLPPCPAIRPNVLADNAAKIARLSGRDVLAKELALAAFGLGWKALDPFPGYTGHPARATAAAGGHFSSRIVDLYESMARDVLYGDALSPEPIMAWTAKLSPFIPSSGRVSTHP